jgi:MFS family permease
MSPSRESLSPAFHRGPFPAFRHRNFRLFFLGQGISVIGTWMQSTAQAWLVLTLTNSPFLLGMVSALQFLPVLLLSLVGGVLADRLPRRRLLMATQTTLMVLAFVLALLTGTGVVRYWHVAALALLLGLTNSLDMPTRQAFFVEMVDRQDLANAIALNSAMINGGRIVGPAVAGMIIAARGVAPAFLLNGLSFLAVIAALALMEVRPVEVVQRQRLLDHIGEGLRYVRETPIVLTTLVMLGLVSAFVLNFNVLIPVLARSVLQGSAGVYGSLLAVLGAGSLIGALFLASASRFGPRQELMYAGAVVVSLAVLSLGFAKSYLVAAGLAFVGGAAMILFTSSSNSIVQTLVPDQLRGRVMSVHAMLFAGSTPVGALLTGGVMDLWGPQMGFWVGGSMGLLAIVAVVLWVRRRVRRSEAAGR